MDHLPTLLDPVQPLPQVPFLKYSPHTYTGPIEKFGGNLKSVPQRSNNAQPQQEYSSFVQQWLYFGLLTDFFSLWKFEVRQTDFIAECNGQQVITNRLLPDYMVAYLARDFNQDQSLLRDKRPTNAVAAYTTVQKKEALQRMDLALGLFHFVHNRLQHDVVQQAVEPAVWDSIILLAGSLIRFWQHVYGSLRPETVSILPPDFSIFTFRSIPDLRTNGAFCVHEQRLLLDLVDRRVNDIAFFSLLGPNDDGVSHASCKPNGCEVYQVPPDTPYRTQHTLDCNGPCEFIGIDADFWHRKAEEREQQRLRTESGERTWGQAFQDMLPEQMKKEAVAVTFDDGKLALHDVQLMKAKTAGWISRQVSDWNMVVFSHVWADGLGNPAANALPICQMRRLQNLANSAYGSPKSNVPFWIDTLLIPVKHKDASEEVKAREEQAKSYALRDMEWMYKFASKVLVLDRRLLNSNCGTMEVEEIGVRIMCSVWSRRLWTLQEGASKGRTCFRFGDRWIHWPDLHEQVLDRGGLSNWRSKHSRLPKGHPLDKAQKIDAWVNKKGGKGTHLDGTAGDALASPLVEAKTGGDKRLFKITSPVWHSIYRFLEELTIDWSGDTKAVALPRCIRGMYYRNCSVTEDEALVLASMISGVPGLAAKLKDQCGKQEQDRYKELYQSMKEVPEDFLFMDQVRYEGLGERWMPRSLLSVSAEAYRPPARTDNLPHMYRLTPR